MKRKLFIGSLLILLLSLFLVACRDEPGQEDFEQNPGQDLEQDDDQDDSTEIMDDFSKLAAGNNPLEIKGFVDENIDKVSQEEADEMLDQLERSLVNNLAAMADYLITRDQENQLMEIAAVDFFFNEEKISEIQDEELRETVEEIFDSGYNLINVEGRYNPIVDYGKLQSYNDYISDEWLDYLEVRAMDSNSPPFVDAAMIIEYEDLAERIIKTENFLRTYPDASRFDKMLEQYEIKQDIYLSGIANTPIAEFDSHKIYDSVYDSYVNTSGHDELVTGKVTERYLEIIDENDRIIDLGVLEKAKELTAEAVDSLK